MTEEEKLPEGYSQDIPRVSKIVEYMAGFEGSDGQERFLNWLTEHGINYEDYMYEASTVGTFIHLQMENYCNGLPLDISNEMYKLHKEEIEAGIQFMKDYKVKPIETELHIVDPQNRYQGSLDLLAEFTSKPTKKIIHTGKCIVDWKTFGIAKKRWGLDIDKDGKVKPYKTEKHKNTKTRLQLSLYANAIGVKRIAIVILHKTGYILHELPLIPKEECDKIVDLYVQHQSKKDIIEYF